MFDEVVKSIASYVSLSDVEIEEFTSRLQLSRYQKSDLLLDTEEVCSAWAFIVEGSFREYYLDENLDEITTNLFTQKNWVLNHPSFTGQKPATVKIEACEDSRVWLLNIHDLHELIGKSPSFFALGKLLDAIQNTTNLRGRPEEKYRFLMENNPDIIQSFPLKHIASYLGMTSETLSRVRNRIR